MKPQCETYEEYTLSKFLLLQYTMSPTVVSLLTTLLYENLTIFLKNRIETHDSKYLFCMRKHIRHYAEYSNTILEGCNFGIKFHSASVCPATRIDNCFTITSNNAEMKAKANETFVSNMFHKSVTSKHASMCKTHLYTDGL